MYQGFIEVDVLRLTSTGNQHFEAIVYSKVQVTHQQIMKTGAEGDTAELTLLRDVFIFPESITDILIDDIVFWNEQRFVVLNTQLEGVTNRQLSVETEAQK